VVWDETKCLSYLTYLKLSQPQTASRVEFLSALASVEPLGSDMEVPGLLTHHFVGDVDGTYIIPFAPNGYLVPHSLRLMTEALSLSQA